jgi:ABC-type Fe3+/spermidine/putrescine transport system ATPase subunit
MSLRIVQLQMQYKVEQNKKQSDRPFKLGPINFELAEGEFLALLGPSGCGKTTLLQAIAGLIKSDTGEAWLGMNQLTWVSPEKRGFGMVFQQPLLFPHMSVVDNVSFGLKMQGIRKVERLRIANEMLSIMGLDSHGQYFPAELSGGQQQRVALARAIVVKPKVLLMDEPFSALDPSLREEMRALLIRIHQQYRMTIVFVTHDREEAYQLADRIGIMMNGSIAQIGTHQQLYENPQSREVAVFLGARNVFSGVRSGSWFEAEFGRIRMNNWDEIAPRTGWLVIRAEILRIVKGQEEQPDAGYIRGILSEVSYRQGFLYMKIEVGSYFIEAMDRYIPNHPQPDLGDLVCLQYNISQVCFIPDPL